MHPPLIIDKLFVVCSIRNFSFSLLLRFPFGPQHSFHQLWEGVASSQHNIVKRWSFSFLLCYFLVCSIDGNLPMKLFLVMASWKLTYNTLLPRIMKKLYLSVLFFAFTAFTNSVCRMNAITNDGIENCSYSKWILNDFFLCLFWTKVATKSTGEGQTMIIIVCHIMAKLKHGPLSSFSLLHTHWMWFLRCGEVFCARSVFFVF